MFSDKRKMYKIEKSSGVWVINESIRGIFGALFEIWVLIHLKFTTCLQRRSDRILRIDILPGWMSTRKLTLRLNALRLQKIIPSACFTSLYLIYKRILALEVCTNQSSHLSWPMAGMHDSK